MSFIKIDTVSPDEYPALTALWERSVRATHHFLPEADILALRPLLLNDFLPQVTLRCTRNQRGEPTGFIGLSDDKVEMLFIDDACRGQRLGRALMDYAVNEAGIRKVDVNEQNPDALAFYQKYGFSVIGRSELDGMGKPYPLLHLVLDNRT
ncbi:GCN5 family N-acetyltransferase [Leminorella grimontii]|uniref:GCN5 family N-acetyltransferase n=1 Tax=Leminorella grimontii TaxID=82981 RepID=A0AAV5MXA1_9GAMM|nr:GNAT family N-acetyltransferase [Leminorella grimontii]KFC96331.1 histone acetyltransferase [Leminorella grimontii ATCC 33999 = DSM 5078]GKX54478.1 GCN5 family N-acetyltransferase [Leminorella grimontii]VFS59153.1 Uncharacterized N-acetyltransferase YjaB [Leminorella grimontii]